MDDYLNVKLSSEQVEELRKAINEYGTQGVIMLPKEEYTIDNIEDMIYALGVELSDPMSGLMIRTLQRNFNEEFKDFTLMEAFDCMVDEVNRVQKLIDLHDILVDISRDDWEKILKGD